MPNLYLVRHGKAKAGWGDDVDPGLDELGRKQAAQAADDLARLGPLEIISSPLARTRQTSSPLADTWKKTPRIEERVGEIASPTKDLEQRTQWLIKVMGEKWPDLDQDLQAWRRGVIEALCELESDTVVFTHFIAINVVTGEAKGDNRVVNFRPGNGSVTIIETSGKKLSLIELGKEADTRVG